jgi:hypothetical protein
MSRTGPNSRLRAAGPTLAIALVAASCTTRLGRPEPSAEPSPAPAAAAPAPEPPATVAASPAANPFADQVRDLLVPTCGRCHLSTLPTAKPAALAIFDFALDPWYSEMTTEQLEGFDRRVQGSDEMDEDAKALVGRFVRCEIEGGCT